MARDERTGREQTLDDLIERADRLKEQLRETITAAAETSSANASGDSAD